MPKTTTQTLAPTQLRVENQPPEDILKQVGDLFEARERNWFELCIALSRVYDDGLFALRGYTKFSEYVEAECPVNYRTAMWAVINGQKIRALNITAAQVSSIGFSKFKELCSIMSEKTTREDALELIDKVKTLSFREVQKMVKEERVELEGGEFIRYTHFNFKMRAEAAEIVKSALDNGKEYFHTETLEDTLEAVLQDWDLNRDPEKSANVKLFVEAQQAARIKDPGKSKHRKHNTPGKGDKDATNS